MMDLEAVRRKKRFALRCEIAQRYKDDDDLPTCTDFHPKRKSYRLCGIMKMIHDLHYDLMVNESLPMVRLEAYLLKSKLNNELFKVGLSGSECEYGERTRHVLLEGKREVIFWIVCKRCKRRIAINITKKKTFYRKPGYMIGFHDESRDTFDYYNEVWEIP